MKIKATKPAAFFLMLLLLCAGGIFSIPAAAKSAELLTNTGFSAVDDRLPKGWELTAYVEDDVICSAEDGIVTLGAEEDNDIRLWQKVKVSENTVYTFRAEILADRLMNGRGASLSIDNYTIDGSYIYSDGILGSCDWTEIELTFRTAKGQHEIVAVLRLGGYSETSQGSVSFRNVSLMKSRNGIPAVQLKPADVSDSTGEFAEAERIRLRSILHLFTFLSVMTGCVLLFGVYRNRERIGAIPVRESRVGLWFVLIAWLGILVRYFLCRAWDGHDYDMGCWISWGSYIAENGPSTFYTAAGHEWYDYPPGYMLVLGGIGKLLSLLHIDWNSHLGRFIYMLPAVFSDIGISWMLLRYAREQKFSPAWQLLLAALAIFNPVFLMLSGVWGQIDSVLSVFLLLSFRRLQKGDRIGAGTLYGLAIAMKWQALIYGPVLAAAYLLNIRSWKDFFKTVLAVLAACGAIMVISIPFRGTQTIFWLIVKFLHTSGEYDYATVEAYNFMAIWGGNWTASGNTMFLGISYKTFGVTCTVLAVALGIAMQIWKAFSQLKAHEYLSENIGFLYLSAAFCMFFIFTFGHYMHERYVFPVLPFLMFAFVQHRDPKLLLSALLLSSVLMLNLMSAQFVVSSAAESIVRSGREHLAVIRLCSAAETATFILFAVQCLLPNGVLRKGDMKNA